jgi:hypothetical protein
LLFFPWEVGERKRDKFPHLVWYLATS